MDRRPHRRPLGVAAAHRRSGKVAYGKFFHQKAGFIARSWFPHFANCCGGDGYDFDSRWDEELATRRQKRVMDLFTGTNEWLSCALKEQAGFQKGGEKNFEGTLTQLQMGGYLLIRDFPAKAEPPGEILRVAYCGLYHAGSAVGV